MRIENIVTIDLNDDMIAEAEKMGAWLDKNKQGAKTRDDYKGKNVIGNLAHNAVEVAFDNHGLLYQSTRMVEYKRGDVLDIKYENDCIDVKGTHGKLDQWFFNKEFLIYKAELDDPKIEVITHFVFVVVDIPDMKAHIYGTMKRDDFIEKSYPVKLNHDNQAIRARQLTPFNNYIFRLRA